MMNVTDLGQGRPPRFDELHLKVKLKGIAWEKMAESRDAYVRLLNKVADALRDDSDFIADYKTIGLSICRELDLMHSVTLHEMLLRAEMGGESVEV